MRITKMVKILSRAMMRRTRARRRKTHLRAVKRTVMRMKNLRALWPKSMRMMLCLSTLSCSSNLMCRATPNHMSRGKLINVSNKTVLIASLKRY